MDTKPTSGQLAACLAALWGFAGVAGGAFGAHGLADTQAKAWAATGGQYLMVHAVAALALLAFARSDPPVHPATGEPGPDQSRTGGPDPMGQALAGRASEGRAIPPAARRGRLLLAAYLLLAGAGVFAGALFALALGGPRWLGAVAPVGGLGLLAGWAMAAFGLLGPARPRV
jgi:uncharacterized membrane protein YgdD (TMEM256/DUF423 family)